MILDSPETEQKMYRTPELVAACEVSSRELQWWDENRIIQPAHVGHHREYTEWEAIEVALVKHMRSRGVSLQTIRKVLSMWRRTGKHNGDRASFLIITKRKVQTAADEKGVIALLSSTSGAAWLIDAAEKARTMRVLLAQGLTRADSGRRYFPHGRTMATGTRRAL